MFLPVQLRKLVRNPVGARRKWCALTKTMEAPAKTSATWNTRRCHATSLFALSSNDLSARRGVRSFADPTRSSAAVFSDLGGATTGLHLTPPRSPLDSPSRRTRSLQRAAWGVGSLSIAFVVLLRAKKLGLLHFHSRTANALFVSIGGLLSSSCCLIQVGMNYLSLGCAGFSALDILRPFFLTTTFGALGARSVLEHASGMRAPRPGSWIAALLLAFLPEILRARNRAVGLKGSWRGGAEAGEEGSAATTTLRFRVAGVKCEGCASGLRETLQAKLTALEPEGAARGAVVAWHSEESAAVRLTVGVGAAGAAVKVLREACAARGYSHEAASADAGEAGI